MRTILSIMALASWSGIWPTLARDSSARFFQYSELRKPLQFDILVVTKSSVSFIESAPRRRPRSIHALRAALESQLFRLRPKRDRRKCKYEFVLIGRRCLLRFHEMLVI
jgi:hypothetical protein